MTQTHDSIRQSVSETYAAAIEAAPEGQVASFGCGSPLAFAGVQPGQTVIDLGSGAGFDLLTASEKVGSQGRVIGVDMTDAMIDAARDAAARAGCDNIEIRKGIIEALPVEDDSADWVISNCVINLSPDKQAVFAEIDRVLAPGGRFSISDIVVDDLPQWLRQSAEAYSACVGGAISEAEYLEGLRAAGFDDVQVEHRLVYDATQLKGLVQGEAGGLKLDAALLDMAANAAAGKVASIKVVGRKRA